MKQYCDKCKRWSEWTTGGCSCGFSYVTVGSLNDPTIYHCPHDRAVDGDKYCRDCGRRINKMNGFLTEC